MVAAGYRPGFIPFGVDDFSLSISIPVITLVNDIPARALMAWDRRLLSRTQNLTLLISGLRGTYPPLASNGTYSRDAIARGTHIQFKVGLSKKYKPGKEHAFEEKQKFGLVDEKKAQTGATPVNEPTVTIGMDGSRVVDEAPQDEDEEIDDNDDDDDGRFDKFSLSNSLESLLDQSLLRVIQFRLKYGLGWAGAEALLAETERLQQTPDTVLGRFRKVNFTLC